MRLWLRTDDALAAEAVLLLACHSISRIQRGAPHDAETKRLWTLLRSRFCSPAKMGHYGGGSWAGGTSVHSAISIPDNRQQTNGGVCRRLPQCGLLQLGRGPAPSPWFAYLPDLEPARAPAIHERVAHYGLPDDLVVVSIHWGENWQLQVPEAMTPLPRC
jgi:hypothetical protein